MDGLVPARMWWSDRIEDEDFPIKGAILREHSQAVQYLHYLVVIFPENTRNPWRSNMGKFSAWRKWPEEGKCGEVERSHVVAARATRMSNELAKRLMRKCLAIAMAVSARAMEKGFIPSRLAKQ